MPSQTKTPKPRKPKTYTAAQVRELLIAGGSPGDRAIYATERIMQLTGSPEALAALVGSKITPAEAVGRFGETKVAEAAVILGQAKRRR